MKKVIVAAALAAVALTACVARPPVNSNANEVTTATGLEYYIQSYTAPDKFGVVCYQSSSSSSNLSCVKVVSKDTNNEPQNTLPSSSSTSNPDDASDGSSR